MRGYYKRRTEAAKQLLEDADKGKIPRTLAAAAFRSLHVAPLEPDELQSAIATGCEGCTYYTCVYETKHRPAMEGPYGGLGEPEVSRQGYCHHASRAGNEEVGPQWWCSEWRGS